MTYFRVLEYIRFSNDLVNYQKGAIVPFSVEDVQVRAKILGSAKKFLEYFEEVEEPNQTEGEVPEEEKTFSRAECEYLLRVVIALDKSLLAGNTKLGKAMEGKDIIKYLSSLTFEELSFILQKIQNKHKV